MKGIFYPDVEFTTLFLPWIHREIYFDKIYAPLNDLRDFVMLDIGANIGEVTRLFQPRAKMIYAVEPSSLEFECFCQNKEYNQWRNVAAFNLAISDADGEANFAVISPNRTMNRLAEDGGIKVKTKRLDTFLQEHGIDHVDFLKMDVEGAEGAILMGDGFNNIADRVDRIMVEYHEPVDYRAVSRHLINLGFRPSVRKTEAIVYYYER